MSSIVECKPDSGTVHFNVYTYLVSLKLKTIDLQQADEKLHMLLQSKIKWTRVQREGIHLARYYMRRWINLDNPSIIAKEFRPVANLIKRWFWTKGRRHTQRKSSCDVIHLLLVTHRSEIQLPQCIVRYISHFFRAQKAPCITLL